MTTPVCENSLQTLMRWFWSALGTATVLVVILLIIVATAYVFVGMVGAVIVMTYGIVQSINAEKRGEQPLVGRATLAIAVYLFGLPILAMLAMMHWTYVDEDIFACMLNAEKILLMFTAYIVFVNLLPKLMRRSTVSVHRHTAFVMAILMFPVYYNILCRVGFFKLLYGPLFNFLDANYGIDAL